ncbi:MAG: helix-turn-helix domain-containing protein [Hyphomicrobiales bacterium]|nr:helix-turn-helix domain-containing protein [Hyphomicrobiales bacterium]
MSRQGMKCRDEIVAHLGPFILARRKELRLSLQDVADRAGCTKSHIWELEKGRATNPTIDLAVSLCGALQCSLNSLLGIDISQPNLTDNELALIAAHRQIFNP